MPAWRGVLASVLPFLGPALLGFWCVHALVAFFSFDQLNALGLGFLAHASVSPVLWKFAFAYLVVGAVAAIVTIARRERYPRWVFVANGVMLAASLSSVVLAVAFVAVLLSSLSGAFK